MVPRTSEIYTLSLHDALPISAAQPGGAGVLDVPDIVHQHQEGAARHAERDGAVSRPAEPLHRGRDHPARGWFPAGQDRKSTRLNSSHLGISYAVFCLKKKKHT